MSGTIFGTTEQEIAVQLDFRGGDRDDDQQEFELKRVLENGQRDSERENPAGDPAEM